TSPALFVMGSAVLGAVVALGFLGASRAWPIAVAFGIIAAAAPYVVVSNRARTRRTRLREVWPEAVDTLVSGVRAGMSLPEALANLGERGPEAVREQFRAFATDYAATARFTVCLDRLKARFADPVADRIVEALRLAHEVGGTELGTLLRALSRMLREDLRTRGELEARQSWTVNGAKVAVAAPWLVLALLSTRPQAARAYATPSGALVLVVGAVASVAAYRLMLRLGRLPEEERVLR
ncbi:MAG: type II secretion system F family protein, partial [Actinomyces sp.]